MRFIVPTVSHTKKACLIFPFISGIRECFYSFTAVKIWCLVLLQRFGYLETCQDGFFLLHLVAIALITHVIRHRLLLPAAQAWSPLRMCVLVGHQLQVRGVFGCSFLVWMQVAWGLFCCFVSIYAVHLSSTGDIQVVQLAVNMFISCYIELIFFFVYSFLEPAWSSSAVLTSCLFGFFSFRLLLAWTAASEPKPNMCLRFTVLWVDQKSVRFRPRWTYEPTGRM